MSSIFHYHQVWKYSLPSDKDKWHHSLHPFSWWTLRIYFHFPHWKGFSIPLLFYFFMMIFWKNLHPFLLGLCHWFLRLYLDDPLKCLRFNIFLCFRIIAYTFPRNAILSIFRVKLIWIFVSVFQSLFFVHCILFHPFWVYWYQPFHR